MNPNSTLSQWLRSLLTRFFLPMVFVALLLDFSVVNGQTFAILGSGTSTNATQESSPVNNYYRRAVLQFVYTATELNAAGIQAGANIDQIGWYVTSNATYNKPGYTVKMKHVTVTNVASALGTTGWTTVVNAITYPTNWAINSWQMMSFNNNFVWNGTDNIGVEVCWSQTGAYTSNGQCRIYSNTSGYRYSWTDAAGNSCGETPGYVNTNKPQAQLRYTNPNPDYRVQYNSTNFGSSNWCPGETRNVTFNVTNTGTQPWTSGWSLPNTVNFSWWWSSQNNQDANPRVLPFSNLAPGASQDVTVSITAPATPGTYTIHSDMVRDAVCWFRNNQAPSCGPGNVLFVSSNITVLGPLTQPVFSVAPTVIPQGIAATYTVNNVAGHSYNWTVPPGWTINSGQGTNSISVTPNATSGSVSVTSTLCNNTSNATSVSVCVAPGDQTTYGNGQWIGYVYQHTNANAPSPAFQNSQYRGYETRPETFDQDWGTGSISGPDICGSYDDRFHIRYRMTKDFPAGWYVFVIGGDDGVRFSVNGGTSWLLNDWSNHGYRTTTSSPTYLSGPANLVFEYYEDGGGARVSFDYGITMPNSNTNYTITTCTGKFFDTGGPVGNYGNSQSRTVTFNPTNPGDAMVLSFSSFASESCCDYLRIHDGNSTGSPVIGTYYNVNPGTITSTAPDGNLTVYFYSDGSVTAAGWEATVSCMTLPPCSGIPSGGTASISASSGCPSTNFTLSATGYTVNQSGLTYQWQSGPSSSGPWSNIGGANNPASHVTSVATTTFFRLQVVCTNSGSSHNSNVVSYAAIEPSVFGNNFWYVYCYNGENFNTYRGYYTENRMGFDSHTRWGRTGSPSSANVLTGSGYVSCSGTVNSDYHSYSYKRRGFPAGTYSISVNRDDHSELIINGVSVHNTTGWGYFANVWTGTLDANSEIEFRVQELTGGSYGGLTFNEVRVPYSGNNTVPCGTDFTLLDHAGITQNSDGGVYSDNAEGYTVIEAGVGATISLNGAYFTESCCDWVRIYDGVGIGGTQLASYQNAAWTAFSYTGNPGQTLTVRFRSDGSVRYEGFMMDVGFSGVCYSPPTISNFTPSGSCPAGGGNVVITGTNYYLVSSVSFNGTPAASFTVNSPTQITAVVPSGFTAGPITVVTAGGSVNSVANFTVYPLPTISGHPQNVTICENLNTSFSVNAPGNTYQWQYSFTPAIPGSWQNTDGAPGLSGHQSATLSITGVPFAYNEASVRCVVTNAQGCSVNSNPALLTVLAAPYIINQPVSISLCPNGQSSINVFAGGADTLTYQWFKDGVPMIDAAPYSGTTTPDLQIDFPTMAEHNSVFHVVVSGGCAPPVISDFAVLTIAGSGAAPAPNPASASSYVICAGDNIVLNGVAPGYTLHWFTQASGGTAIATSASGVNTGPISPTSNTTYYVEAHLGGCISQRRLVGTVFIINPNPPQINYAPPVKICVPGPVSLSSTTCTPGTVLWYDNANGCVPIHVGNPFNTSVAATTTFYSNIVTNVINANSEFTSDLGNNSFYGLAGQMFDVQAAPGKTLEINAVRVRPYYNNSSAPIRVYYKTEPLQIPTTFPAGTLNGTASSWTLVHDGTHSSAAGSLSAWIPLQNKILVPAGCRFAVYIFYPVDYRGNSGTGDDRSNQDIIVYGTGLGAANSTTEFNMGADLPRGFRGALRYDVRFVSPIVPVPVILTNVILVPS